jgi:transcriptional regulator with GAF, ATPase, and Fis domain
MGETWERLEKLSAALRGAAGPDRDRLEAEWREVVAQARKREADREALLREISLVLSGTGARRVLELMMDAVVRLSGAERGFILLSREDGVQEIVAARQMDRDHVSDAAETISRRVVTRVLATERTLLLEDAVNTAPFSLAESVTRLKLLSVLCVPIRSEGRVVGVMYLENRRLSGVFTVETERLVGEFSERVGAALRNAKMYDELMRRRDELQSALGATNGFDGVVGENGEFRNVLRVASVAAKSDIPVLVEGESGTGKELVARAIHRDSPRSGERFVSINCAALPQMLLESELFGHRKGAFTGASEERQGLFLWANGGTLFLDEVGEMPPELQARLLRVLQSGEVRAVGSDELFRVDVRIVAATRRRMEEEVKEGRFREDLFFRLNGVHIRVPPLRERKEDVPVLIAHFIERHGHERQLSLESDARACLMAYDWPGNVRELETVIRRAVLFAQEGIISVGALPDYVKGGRGEELRLGIQVPTTGGELLAAKRITRATAVRELEKAFLRNALKAAGGRPGEAAKLVEMNRSQFERMLSRHGMAGKGAGDPRERTRTGTDEHGQQGATTSSDG